MDFVKFSELYYLSFESCFLRVFVFLFLEKLQYCRIILINYIDFNLCFILEFFSFRGNCRNVYQYKGWEILQIVFID